MGPATIPWLDAALTLLLASLAVRTFAASAFCDRGGFVDEAIPLRQAITLWGWGHEPPTLDPRFFSYPSASIYLHAIAQGCAILVGRLTGHYPAFADAGVEFALDPTWLVTAGRALSWLALLGAAAAILHSERGHRRLAAACAGAAVCLSPLLVRSALQMPPEILMCPLLVLLVGAVTSPGAAPGPAASPWRAGVLAGLLCGLKLSALPAALLVLVLASRTASSSRTRVHWFALAGALGLLAFLATSPYALLDARRFASDVAFEWRHLRFGHLGGGAMATLRAHAWQLWEAFGPALPAAALAAGIARPTLSRGGSLALGTALTMLVPPLLARSGGPERYVVPAVPLLWWFVSQTAAACAMRPGRLARATGFVLIALMVGQVVAMGTRTLRAAGPTPVARASAWIRGHTTPADILIQEYGASAVFTRDQQQELVASRCYAAASPRWRAAAETAVAHAVVTLPFVASGDVATRVADESGREFGVRAWSPGWNMMPAVYRALHGFRARAILRSESISGRLGVVFPELAFDQPLNASRTRALFAPEVSRGSDPAHASVAIEGDFDETPPAPAPPPGDWAREADFVIEGDATRAANGGRRLIALARTQVFRERFEPLLLELGSLAVERRDGASAVDAARQVVVNDPDKSMAIRMAMLALGELRVQRIATRDGSAVLARTSSETDSEWITIVLSEWGCAPGVIGEELSRYEAWRAARRREAR